MVATVALEAEAYSKLTGMACPHKANNLSTHSMEMILMDFQVGKQASHGFP